MITRKTVLNILVFLLLAAICCGTASAEGAEERIVTWKVTTQEIDEKTLLDETFDRKEGEDFPELLEEKGEYNIWSLQGNSEPLPFCVFSHWNNLDFQLDFSICRHGATGKAYDYYYDTAENIIREECGFQAERSAETIARSEDLLKRLGLYGEHYAPAPLEFTTYGRLEGTTKSREVVFEERLEGLPVRWAEKALYIKGENTFGPAVPLIAEMIWSDEEGLLTVSGDWSTFTPLSRAANTLSAEEAAAKFAGAGMDKPQPEACWFLDVKGKEATATLAWRVENTYLSAVDGSWLQTQ